MLLELTGELATDLTGEEVDALENILLARRAGIHLLIGHSDVFGALGEIADLSSRARGILRRSGHRQIQKVAVLEAVTRRIVVSRDRGPMLESDEHGEAAVVPLRHFAPNGLAGRAVLLGEGEWDACLASRMARHFARTQELEGVHLQVREDAGGGHRMKGAFRRCREEPRLCLCVVDSDRVAPNGKKGSTATKARSEVDEAKPWADVHVMACREMENALPLGLVEAAFGDDHQRCKALRDMARFEAGEVLEMYRDYCDFKKGTRLKWVFEMDERERSFWLESMATAALAPSVKPECVTEGACRKKDCDCLVAPSFGSSLLETCFKAAASMGYEELDRLLCEKTRPHWHSMGRAVFSWGCGTQPSYA